MKRTSGTLSVVLFLLGAACSSPAKPLEVRNACQARRCELVSPLEEAQVKAVGMAPGADLIAARVGTQRSLPNTYLMGAICAWVDKVAGSTRVSRRN